jgi:hypothetical protein
MDRQTKAIMHVLIWALLIIFFISCSTKETLLRPVGDIMDTEEDMVLGIFPETKTRNGLYYAQWFYFPGMGWVSGDTHYLKVVLVEKSTGKEVLSDD